MRTRLQLKDYHGEPMFPAAPVHDLGCRPLHFQVKVAMHLMPARQAHQASINHLHTCIKAAASIDPSLQPIRRYREDRKLLNAALKKYHGAVHVQTLLQVRSQGCRIVAACSDLPERAASSYSERARAPGVGGYLLVRLTNGSMLRANA